MLKILISLLTPFSILSLFEGLAFAGEADLAIPDLHEGHFAKFGGISGWNLLFYRACIIAGTLGISRYLRGQIHRLPAHKSMLSIAEIIYQTCRTYLIQQGNLLLMP